MRECISVYKICQTVDINTDSRRFHMTQKTKCQGLENQFSKGQQGADHNAQGNNAGNEWTSGAQLVLKKKANLSTS